MITVAVIVPRQLQVGLAVALHVRLPTYTCLVLFPDLASPDHVHDAQASGHRGSIFALAARRPPSEGITLRCLIGIPAVHHPINRSAGVVFTSALFTCAIRPRPLPTAVGREQQIAQRTGPGARLLPAFLLTLVILQGIHLNPANECDALVAFNLPLGSFGKVDSAHACCSAAVSQKLSAKPQD